MKTKIPLVVIEEHHEAFYVWNYAEQNGWLDTANSTLLHIDEHADMAVPRLRRPLSSLGSLHELETFVYDELTINDFIWAAVYQGHFKSLLWMRSEHTRSAGGWRHITMRPLDAGELTFSTVSSTLADPPVNDGRTVEYAPIKASDSVEIKGQIALDIDLDYFAWNKYPDPGECRLEVSKESFSAVVGNRYHWLRTSPGSKVSAVGENGHYFLIFDDGPVLNRSIDTVEQVEKRIQEFMLFLQRNHIRPSLVTLCRSFITGYTQKAHAKSIERTLIRQLTQMFPEIQTMMVDQLLGNVKLQGELCLQ